METTSILTCFELWEGLKQGFRLTRTITRDGPTTTEVVHGITSLSEERADPSRLLELVRSGNAPQVLAAMRNLVVCLLSRQLGETHPDVIERLAARPHEALNLLTGSNSNSL